MAYSLSKHGLYNLKHNLSLYRYLHPYVGVFIPVPLLQSFPVDWFGKIPFLLFSIVSRWSGEVAAGIAAFVLKGQLKEVIEVKMKEGMQHYGQFNICFTQWPEAFRILYYYWSWIRFLVSSIRNYGLDQFLNLDPISQPKIQMVNKIGFFFTLLGLKLKLYRFFMNCVFFYEFFYWQ